MTLKTFYKPFLFKSLKRMDTIRVAQFLHYRAMIWILCFKPSFFNANEPSLYSSNLVGILIKLIFLRGGILIDNQNNVVFAWIFCMRNITFFKIDNDVLTILQLFLIYIPLRLQSYIIMFMTF